MSPDYANDVRAFMRLQGRELPDRPRDLAPVGNLCHECLHKLEPDMWIDEKAGPRSTQ